MTQPEGAKDRWDTMAPEPAARLAAVLDQPKRFVAGDELSLQLGEIDLGAELPIAPGDDELAQATALVDASDEVGNERSSGAWRGDRDEMVDEASVHAARRLLADNFAGRSAHGPPHGKARG